MVYTKHFTIHSVKHLNQAEEYIENAVKTTLDKNSSSDSHFDNMFPYVFNENKTISKQLVSSFGIIDVNNAANEFMITKERAEIKKGTHLVYDPHKKKMVLDKKSIEQGNGNGQSVLAHHLIQSFSPEDNLSPEKINEIGYQTVLELTGGQYEFVVATHIDKEHIHNHIIFNSTNLKTGKAFRWQKGTKKIFEKVSDKIASKEGAKIINKSPKNSHKKYTMWQTESMFKEKIKSRLNFLLEHSSSINDFIQKADALHLSVDFSKKWATYKLLDEPQIKNTRSRGLSKNNPTKYNYESIIERLKMNTTKYSVENIVALYEEKVNKIGNDFDYQLTIDDWQISHKTDKGYYINVDFGFGKQGKLFIGAYKVDPISDSQYNIYVKRNDYFYLMNEKNSGRNRYMTGETLIKQLRLYNGSTPLKKEPVMRTIDELVEGINFLAVNGIEDTRQMKFLEQKLEASFFEAEETLEKLDKKIIELNNAIKKLITNENVNIQKKLRELLPDATLSKFSIEDIQEEIESITMTQSLLETKLENTRKEINKLHEIQAVQSVEEEKNNYPKI